MKSLCVFVNGPPNGIVAFQHPTRRPRPSVIANGAPQRVRGAVPDVTQQLCNRMPRNRYILKKIT